MAKWFKAEVFEASILGGSNPSTPIMIPNYIKIFARKKGISPFQCYYIFVYRKVFRMIAHLENMR